MIALTLVDDVLRERRLVDGTVYPDTQFYRDVLVAVVTEFDPPPGSGLRLMIDSPSPTVATVGCCCKSL